MRTNAIEDNASYLDLGLDGTKLDQIYLEHYAGLFRYAYTMVHESSTAEEIIHNIFLKLLERNEPLRVHTSLKAYLYRSVNNECLNHIKHQKIKGVYEVETNKAMSNKTQTPLAQLQYRELEERLRTAINELPEQCRSIFQLSRFEDLKYAEIAAQLGLSVKTVETQMGRALKKLRVQLADYLPLVLITLLTNILYLIHLKTWK